MLGATNTQKNSVQVQLVGDRRHTRVEERVLHLDVAASAIKLVQKGSVRVLLSRKRLYSDAVVP